MRFHSTAAFGEKVKAIKVALGEFEVSFDRDAEGNDTAEMLKAHMASVIECLQHPAVTPTELGVKLSLYRDNNVADWADGPMSRDAFEAMINDTVTLQGHYPGPDMFAAFAEWRKVEEVFQYAPDHESEEGGVSCRLRSLAFRVLMSTECTTAGDFIVKSYVNLLGLVGHTWFGDAKESGLGNVWDINIANEDDPVDDTCAFHRAAYNDIDYTDIGANLLAYGLPVFSAEAWMERADAIGLRVGVVDFQGKRTFWQSMGTDADPASPAGREAYRLQRIMAFDTIRTAEVVQEIERDWPQLISPSPVGGA